ncbi:hypothetical protein [Azospirillum thermophilum]|uniref:hypothetical protein n=1 Tax=Azospirillum thermophilum TaxID=2202148 RepID=UPI001FE35392|nr:hypothetical protein [Azospirillum thermophilum]
MKLAGLLRLILAVACLSSGALAARAEPFRFTILYAHSTTDLEEARPRGGLPRLAALVRQERAERGTVLVLHGGQTLAPSVLAFYDQGAHIIDLLNGIGPDVMAALNREFHHGDDKLMTRAFEAGFPMITTNAIDRATGKPPDGLESAVVLRAGPFRVGVLAGTPLQTKETTRTPQTEFRDPAVAIAERARAMKAEGVDLTVALTSSSGNTHTAVIAARPTDIVLYQDRGRDIGVDYDGKFLSATVAPQANYVLALDITIDRVGERDSQRLVWSRRSG